MTRDIVVIGGSAGGVEAILRLARTLPEDLPAAILVVIHTSPSSNGELAGLINRAGRLACSLAEDGAEIQAGRIYLARPDYHLLVEPGRIRVIHGPRENRHRPAVDPLFRSAAVAYGPRVIGIILSGTLDDGAAGLAVVKKHGGLALVQHPEDALFPGMPRNAMAAVEVDHAVSVKGIPELLAKLAREEVEPAMETSDWDQAEAGISGNRLVDEGKMREMGIPSTFTCPDCGGALFECKDPGVLRFRCSIGHGMSGLTLLAAQTTQVEEALAASFRSLVEKQRLYSRIIDEFNRKNLHFSIPDLKEKAEAAAKHAGIIQALLTSIETREA